MIVNTLKTYALLAALSYLFLSIGYLCGGTMGLHIALLMSIIVNGSMYYFSDKIVLKMYRAAPLDAASYAAIHGVVEEIAHRMKIPKPKLWRIPMTTPNAFATGRSPAHASVALTDSLITLLSEDELRGVLAHELSHIKNYDMLVNTYAATFAGAIGYIASMLQHIALWSAFQNKRDRSKGSPLFLLFIAFIAPCAALIVRLAISRSREYLADQTGAQYAHPLDLAHALRKIETYAVHTRADADSMHQASTASLFITNPFRCRQLLSLFSTHPPIEDRIARLEQMHANSLNR